MRKGWKNKRKGDKIWSNDGKNDKFMKGVSRRMNLLIRILSE
jgi:hypothetical protein